MTRKKFAVEGNIGTGKSTFTQIMKDNIEDSYIVPEPIDKWNEFKDIDNENILQKFYKDKKTYAARFQFLACITRMEKCMEASKNSDASVLFFDRSIGTDKNVFEKMLYDDGFISEIDNMIYNTQYDFYNKYVNPDAYDHIIYLRCDPIVSYNRIMKRNRIEEKDITVEYLTKIHNYHEEWLINCDKVIVIDCNKDFENDMQYRNEIIDIVRKLI